MEERRRRAGDVLRPDPEWYRAIGGDQTVRRALEIFYERVFSDPVLAPFFATVDKPTIIAKQVGFMKRCFTGEKNAYIGQRPRNAHHHLVISEGQFDHRERLMREALAEVGLRSEQIERWIAVEEVFRRQIVKERPVPLFYNGFATYWADEAKEERLTCAATCDRCGGEVLPGDSLWVVGERAVCGGCRDLE